MGHHNASNTCMISEIDKRQIEHLKKALNVEFLSCFTQLIAQAPSYFRKTANIYIQILTFTYNGSDVDKVI